MIRVKRKSSSRKGAAVAELAICLPAILLLVLGAIECTSMIFLRQTLAITAYEGVRIGIKSDTTTADVNNRCNRLFTERDVTDGMVTTDPVNTEVAGRGEPVTVVVSAPADANSILPLQFFGGDLQATAIMIKE